MICNYVLIFFSGAGYFFVVHIFDCDRSICDWLCYALTKLIAIKVLNPDLFVNECNPANLLNDGLGCCPVVDEVCRDGDGQFAAELFSLET